MSFDDHYTPQTLEEILRLPSEIAELRYRYPKAITLLSDYQDAAKYDLDYVPEVVEVFYKDTDGEDPYIVLEKGKIDWVDFSQAPDISQSIIMLCCDDTLAYLEIEGKIVFNCLHEHQLPEIIALPGEQLAIAIANFLAQQEEKETL